MNINVREQGGRHVSLGMLRVHGSMPAEKCVKLLASKLSEFGLNLNQGCSKHLYRWCKCDEKSWYSY